MNNTAIAASGLRKASGDKVVLDGIDFEVPAGTVFSATRVLPGSVPDEENLTLNVPSGSDTASLRALLARLDEYAISAAEFSVHTPGLDDVFLALTGHDSDDDNASDNRNAKENAR